MNACGNCVNDTGSTYNHPLAQRWNFDSSLKQTLLGWALLSEEGVWHCGKGREPDGWHSDFTIYQFPADPLIQLIFLPVNQEVGVIYPSDFLPTGIADFR